MCDRSFFFSRHVYFIDHDRAFENTRRKASDTVTTTFKSKDGATVCRRMPRLYANLNRWCDAGTGRCNLSDALRKLLLETGDAKEMKNYLPYLGGVDARAAGLFAALRACRKRIGAERAQLFSECGTCEA